MTPTLATVPAAQTATEERLTASGAMLEGHFRLSSGLHSDRYIQCARLLEQPRHARWAGAALAEAIQEATPVVDRVVSPALGGVVIGHETASALDVPFAFAERIPDGPMDLRRGFHVAAGERIAVVEDVVTTGGSVAEVIRLLRDAGAEVLTVGTIIRRDPSVDEIASVPVVTLADLPAKAVDRSACPACTAGAPIEVPGSRAVEAIG